MGGGIGITGDATPEANSFNIGTRGYTVASSPLGGGRAYGGIWKSRGIVLPGITSVF